MSFNRANSYTVQMDEIRTKTSQAEALAARKEGEISVLENDMLHNNQSIERIKRVRFGFFITSIIRARVDF